ncbi:MAG: hypothetical protein H8D82_01705 [Euryarchaeota archaeon]|nr:hypothetical protein [Euryarchaeota archaeon]
MEWQPITIEKMGEKRDDSPVGPHTEGLSATPELLHQEFLSDLGHLQEIHDSHSHAVHSNFTEVESNFDRVAGVISTQAMLNRFHGQVEGRNIALPLHGCELSGVSLSQTEVEGTPIIKLLATGKDGSSIEQAFTLPKGRTLATASWHGGELHLNLNQ